MGRLLADRLRTYVCFNYRFSNGSGNAQPEGTLLAEFFVREGLIKQP